MVVGGYRLYGEPNGLKEWINDIEVVSLDPANDAVPACLQNFNPFPALSISGCIVRF